MASRDSLRLADVIGFLVVVTIAILAWKWSPSSDDQNAKEWEVYKSRHKCESPSHRPQPADGQKAWKCDDGRIWIR